MGDDRTPSGDLGYRVTHLDGQLPDGLRLPDTPIPAEGGALFFAWHEEKSGKSLNFTLGVRALDRAGNEGELREVKIRRGGGGGCAQGVSSPFALLIVLALALKARRRG